MSYRDIPALAAYIDRVGAEELNFKRFMVKQFSGDHYYSERCLIRIHDDGEISVTNKEYAPTKEEAAAIKGALLSAKFPKCVKATAANVAALRKQVGSRSTLYEFHDRAQKGVVMVQERTVIDGRKAFLPWTFWSDGEWRRMEPEGPLPFWKPETRTKSARIMVHEGAKTAEFVHRLITDPEMAQQLREHPWAEELKEYEHWGMIGGALAPHRSHYAELSREKPTEVIYVCDNDYAGKSALREVSRCYGQPMKGIMFDERWPQAWDMADPMPERLFTKAGRYVGPELRTLVRFATWATETIPNPEGAGRPITVLRSTFAEEWFHGVTPEVFVHREWPSTILTAQEFNNAVRPFSDVDDTARLVKRDAAAKSMTLRFMPGMKPGIYSDEAGTRYVNTHCPSNVKAEKGDPALWLEFLAHLIPDEQDREELMRWCATLIARPDIKMLYGVLMISEMQGVGKGTLGEKILAPLVGEENVSYPSESEIVESGYNYWAAHKRLAVVHEIYAGHSAKAYNKLKSVVTDRYITVSKKYQANYDIENWIHVFACSNSMRAIQLSMDDRRWFVPKVTEVRQPAAFWQRFNRWLSEEGGLNVIKWWAGQFLKDHAPVLRGESAPWSAVKREIVEEGYSPGMALVAELLDRLKEEAADRPMMLLDTDLVRVVRDHLYEGRHSDKLERPATLRKLAKSKGWHVGDQRVQLKEWGARGSHARVITNDPLIARMGPKELAAWGRPADVAAMATKWYAL